MHGGKMIGDTILFFNNSNDPTEAEIEIMIAEKDARGKGLGKEALLIMMWFAITKLNVKKIVSRIGDQNIASIHLFKKLNFLPVSHSSVFKETTFELLITLLLRNEICEQLNYVIEGQYDK